MSRITREGRSAVVLVSLADCDSQQEREYLLRSPANRESLQMSLRQAERGGFVVKTIEELETLAQNPPQAQPK